MIPNINVKVRRFLNIRCGGYTLASTRSTKRFGGGAKRIAAVGTETGKAGIGVGAINQKTNYVERETLTVISV